MDSPNGVHRLAKAISFLINRINSAMLNHNDSNKNSWCDNQSAPKTFITIIFISLRERQWQWVGLYWSGISDVLIITLELAADTATTPIHYKPWAQGEQSSGFIFDTSLDVGPFSEEVNVFRTNKLTPFWNDSEWGLKLQSWLICRDSYSELPAALQQKIWSAPESLWQKIAVYWP